MPSDAAAAPVRHRIEFLDGMRGLAIGAVLLFHAFARWPDRYPYGGRFLGNHLLDTRTAGVNLFFIISGFVILMSLRKCAGFAQFMARRWRRLFPAMLVCSLIVFIASPLFPERPAGAPHLRDLLPGLTFIGADDATAPLWQALAPALGGEARNLEAAFWSLYVEMRFYVVFGAAYFLLGERWSIAFIAGLYVLGELTSATLGHLRLGPHGLGAAVGSLHGAVSVPLVEWIVLFLHAKTYGFFASGALFFRAHEEGRRELSWLASGAALLSALSSPDARAMNLALALVFILAMWTGWMRSLLAARALVFLGFVSYPLYLLHENMMVAMIVKLGRALPWLPALALPLLPIAAVVAAAWGVAAHLEPRVQRWVGPRRRATDAARA